MTALAAQPVGVLPFRERLTLRQRASRPEAVACRVCLLILAIMMMGLVDLVCTITYMRHIGMIELNPIARFLAATGGAGSLVIFKFSTMAASSTVLFIARHRRGTEACAWVGFAMLLALMVHWAYFNAAVPHVTEHLANIAHVSGRHAGAVPEAWIKLDM